MPHMAAIWPGSPAGSPVDAAEASRGSMHRQHHLAAPRAAASRCIAAPLRIRAKAFLLKFGFALCETAQRLSRVQMAMHAPRPRQTLREILTPILQQGMVEACREGQCNANNYYHHSLLATAANGHLGHAAGP